MAAAGFWERGGRNPALGAFLATTMIAALYSLAGNLVFLAYMLGDMEGMRAIDWNVFRSGIIERYRAPMLILTMVFEFAFFGAGTYVVFRRWHGTPLGERFRFQLPAPAALPLSLVGLAGLFPLALLAGELFERAFPFIREFEASSEGLTKATDPASWALLVATVCVTPALCEEFLFRGYLQGNVGRVIKSPWSYILTGGFFALIHQNYFGLGALLIIGIYLAFVFETSGSIWPGMLVHFIYNGAAVLLSNLKEPLSWAFGPEGFVRLPFVLASLPLAAVGIGSLLLLGRRRSLNS
jgi:membrane protease YdiL (CAAX protease family)